MFLLKKIFASFILIVLVAFLSGCSYSEKIPQVTAKIDGNAVIEYGNTEYKCNMARLADGVSFVKILSPENIAGFEFREADGKFSVSYGELVCKTESVILPENSFPVSVLNILSAVSADGNLLYCSSENENYKFTGNSDTGMFEVFTDKDGNITGIFQESTDLKITFQKT